jgi:recombinational DNA repair protein RecT
MSKESTLAIINSTPANQIVNLEFVKNRFIENYNLCHNSTEGEKIYNREVIHLNQITSQPAFQNIDKFSIYACIATAAAKNLSFDPIENEVYLIPRGGKACMQLQAGAYVKRLLLSNQIISCEQPKIVYKGDIFEVENGNVTKHVEKFESEHILAGYVKFNLIGGVAKYFVYRWGDFLAWKKKSQQPNGENWSGGFEGQPVLAFLRTKIVLHAAKEKCWATGNKPVPVVEEFNVIVEDEEVPYNNPAIETPTEPATPIVPPTPYTAFEVPKTTQEPATTYEAF